LGRKRFLRSLRFETLEPRVVLDTAFMADPPVSSPIEFAHSPAGLRAAEGEGEVLGDAPGAEHTFKVRVGDKADRSQTYYVGESLETRHVEAPITVRRFLGEEPAEMSIGVSLVEGNPDWWEADLSLSSFTLGGAPTHSTGDVDDPGVIDGRLGDGDIDDDDLAAFDAHFTGNGTPLTADKTAVGIQFDFDGDLDVDEDDRAVLLSHYTGPVVIPWNRSVNLSVTASPDAPEGAAARFQVTATNSATGENASTFVHVVKKSHAPWIGLRIRVDATRESDTKLAFGRVVSYDLSVRNRGAETDRIHVEPEPVEGFSFRTLDWLGRDASTLELSPDVGPKLVRLYVTTPQEWPVGSEQTITVVVRSDASGLESSTDLKAINAGSLWNPSDLLREGGRRHSVQLGGVTSFGFTVHNAALMTRTIHLSAAPSDSAADWTAQFDTPSVSVPAGQQAFVTMSVAAPESATLGTTATWTVQAAADDDVLGVNSVGVRVSSQPKIILVNVDGLSPAYLNLDSRGTGIGTEGDWLMPNVRSFMERGATYTNASSPAPHKHQLSVLTGSYPGAVGMVNSPEYYVGRDADGAAITRFTYDIGPSALRFGPDGDQVESVFDVARQVNPDARSAFVTSKGWMQPYFNARLGGPVDVIAEGREMPLYISEPTTYYLGDPPSDDDPLDPRPESSALHVGLIPGSVPPDRWVMDAAIKILDSEDPGVTYITLGAVDEAAHAFGAAANPDEWDDRGTPSTYDDVSRIHPRATREEILDVVRETDALLGQLLDRVGERGTLDDTYVVLLADHGSVTHCPHVADLSGFLESHGYSNMNDFRLHGRSGGALIYDVANGELASMEQVLENGDSIAPGMDRNPWIVLNRTEMMTGVDEHTGRRVAEPGELYSQYYVEQGGSAPDVYQWPEFVVLMKEKWAIEYVKFNGEDQWYVDDYLGGYAGPATAGVPLIMAGPSIPAGAVSNEPVETIDIAPTLYALLAWPVPDNVQGDILPGIAESPVRQEGGTLHVTGIGEDDVFVFNVGDSHVSLNGETYEFDQSTVSTIRFVGGFGADTATLTGSDENDIATLRPNSATMTGPGYEVQLVDVSNVTVHGGTGEDDRAYFYDSAGDDRFEAQVHLDYAYIDGEGFHTRAEDFDRIYAYATAGGEDDRAYFYDSAGDDRFVPRAYRDDAYMYGEGFFTYTKSFDRSYAYATAGGEDDRVYFYDSPGNDRFVPRAYLGDAYMYGEGFYTYARGFDRNYAYAIRGGLDDRAYFYDSAGDDEFVVRAYRGDAYMHSDGFYAYANAFDRSYAYATAGGDDDRAYFYDSAGNDQFVARAYRDDAYMYGLGYYVYAQAFDRNHAYATRGGARDRAHFYDSAGNDRFVARAHRDDAYMSGQGFYNYAQAFDRNYAYATAGGEDDRAYLYDSPGDDRFAGRAHRGDTYMSGQGFYNYAKAFDLLEVASNYDTDHDRAYFYNSVGRSVTKEVYEELVDFTLVIEDDWLVT